MSETAPPQSPADLGREAARLLLGTCKAVYDLGEEFEGAENDMAFCDALDDKVFCCTDCGWWFEHPANDGPNGAEWVCDECFVEAGGELDG